MSNQTPTNWATSKDAVPDGWTQITVYDENSGKRIATVYSEAAATLIEAAPNMLKALKNLVDLAEAHFATSADLWEVNEAKAAIAKAEGASNENRHHSN